MSAASAGGRALEPKRDFRKEGELQVRGPSVFSEYYINREATIAAFTATAGFRTPRPRGGAREYYAITGRSKDLKSTAAA
jgi:long-subunit acyl-CoA synthetase (AMP-forming)